MSKNVLILFNHHFDSSTCFLGFICANSSFIAVYTAVFAIVITLSVYIYGLTNQDEKNTLLKNTKIKEIINYSLYFFIFSFLLLPGQLYGLINFTLVAIIVYKIISAFRKVFEFNKSAFFKEKAIKEFKDEIIKQQLADLKKFDDKNNEFNLELTKEKNNHITQSLSLDGDEYYWIKSSIHGCIVNINLDILPNNNVMPQSDIDAMPSKIEEKKDNKLAYYIPHDIAYGALVSTNQNILGVKNIDKKNLNENKKDQLRAYIEISSNYESPVEYLKSEIRFYYSEIFPLIKAGNIKGLELKLNDLGYFLHKFLYDECDGASYLILIELINDEVIRPLQGVAFKQKDVDCIKELLLFMFNWANRSFDVKYLSAFQAFMRNINTTFYLSFDLDESSQNEIIDLYIEWAKNAVNYYTNFKINNNESLDYSNEILFSLHESLKVAFDKNDIQIFIKLLNGLNSLFFRRDYRNDIDNNLILTIKSIIFGLTSCVYKFNKKENEVFIKLFEALELDSNCLTMLGYDEFNYIIAVYLKTIKISQQNGNSLGWNSWRMPKGEVYTVTLYSDLDTLLIDRLLWIIKKNKEFDFEIKNKKDDLNLASLQKRLDHSNKSLFLSMRDVNDDEFLEIKNKLSQLFKKHKDMINEHNKQQLLTTSIDEEVFNKFAIDNLYKYKKFRTLIGISKSTQCTSSDKVIDNTFGYNTLLHKELFIADSSVSHIGRDEFGKYLAIWEDNKILKDIYDKFNYNNLAIIQSIKKPNIWGIIQENKQAAAVVFWTNKFINLDKNSPSSFTPSWKENKLSEESFSYKGTLGKTSIYVINKLVEDEGNDNIKDDNLMFIFKSGAFTIEEFNVSQDYDNQSEVTKMKNDINQCVSLSITNLNDNQKRENIVNSWINKNKVTKQDEQRLLEELKSRVLFKFLKRVLVKNVVIRKIKIMKID